MPAARKWEYGPNPSPPHNFMMRIIPLFTLAGVFGFSVAFGAEPQSKPTCAILSFDAQAGITPGEARILSDRFAAEIGKIDRFTLISRDKMDQILRLQSDSFSSCSANDCAIEAGQLLSAQYIIYGSIGKIGQTFTVNANQVNIENGAIEFSAAHDITGPIDDLLKFGMGQLAHKLHGLTTPPNKPSIAGQGPTPAPPSGRIIIPLDGAISMEFLPIPAGSFLMGSPLTEEQRDSSELLHKVSISQAFWMSKHEVTLGQWQSLMGQIPAAAIQCRQRVLQSVTENAQPQSPSKSFLAVPDPFRSKVAPSSIPVVDDPSRLMQFPITHVRWTDAIHFINRLNTLMAKLPEYQRFRVRLPTEAEWEYACRAGTDTATCWGNFLRSDQACFDRRQPYRSDSSGASPLYALPVGSFDPNAWGLHDMHGNVAEWCSDWWSDYPNEEIIDPVGPSYGQLKVVRGGSWYDDGNKCRSAARQSVAPASSRAEIGFRLVLTTVANNR